MASLCKQFYTHSKWVSFHPEHSFILAAKTFKSNLLRSLPTLSISFHLHCHNLHQRHRSRRPTDPSCSLFFRRDCTGESIPSCLESSNGYLVLFYSSTGPYLAPDCLLTLARHKSSSAGQLLGPEKLFCLLRVNGLFSENCP